MQAPEFRFDTLVASWWSKIEASSHPLDLATGGIVSSAVLEAIEPLDEHLLVDEVLYMLQGLECELFVLEMTEKEGDEAQTEEESDSIHSRPSSSTERSGSSRFDSSSRFESSIGNSRYESSWRWTTRKRGSLAHQRSSTAPCLAHLTSKALLPLLNHFMRLATSLSRLKLTIQIAKKNYGSATSIFASCLEEHVKSAESLLQMIQNYHHLNNREGTQQTGNQKESKKSGERNPTSHHGGTQSVGTPSISSQAAPLALHDLIQQLVLNSSSHASSTSATRPSLCKITLIGLHSLTESIKEVVEYLERVARLSTSPLPSLDYSPHLDDLYPDRPKKSKASRASMIFEVLDSEMSAMQVDSDWKHIVLMRFTWRLLAPLLEKIDLWTIHSYLSIDDMDEFCIVKLGSLDEEKSRTNLQRRTSSSLLLAPPSSASAALAHYDVTSPLFWEHSFGVNEDFPAFLKSAMPHLLSCGKASLLVKYIQQEILQQQLGDLDLQEGYEPLFTSALKHFSSLRLPQHCNHPAFAPTPDDFLFEDLLPIQQTECHPSKEDAMDEAGLLSPPDAIASRTLTSSSMIHLDMSLDIIPSSKSKEFKQKTRSETRFFNAPSFGEDSEWPTSDESSIREASTVGDSAISPVTTTHRAVETESPIHNGLPFSAFISDCILQPLTSRYSYINKKLMDLLITECSVLKRIETAQQFFFLARPISDLYALSIFPSLWSYSAVGEVTANHWLKLAIETSAGGSKFENDFSDYYGASLHIIQKPKSALLTQSSESKAKDDESDKLLKRLEDISKIWIEFDAPWPASLFLDRDAHVLYNSISQTLSPLMAAQFALEQLTTQNKFTTEEARTTVHQMHLFKNELLCFLRNLREYMVSRVLQVPWKDLERDMRNAVDLDAMRAIHRVFLMNIKERCLLTERFVALRKALDRMVEIALDFSRLFQLIHASLDPNSRSSNMNMTHASEFAGNVLFSAGVGVDKEAIERVWKIVVKSKAEFQKLLKFLLSVLSKMASSSIYLADLHLRLNFSNFYQE